MKLGVQLSVWTLTCKSGVTAWKKLVGNWEWILLMIVKDVKHVYKLYSVEFTTIIVVNEVILQYGMFWRTGSLLNVIYILHIWDFNFSLIVRTWI